MLAGWQPRFGASPHPFLQWSGNLSTISQASQTPVTLGKVPTPPAGTLVTQRSNGHPGLGCSFLVPGSSALPLVWWLPTAPTQSYLLPMPHRPHGHSSLASGTEEQQPAGSVPGQLSQQVPHTFSVSPGPVLTPPV